MLELPGTSFATPVTMKSSKRSVQRMARRWPSGSVLPKYLRAIFSLMTTLLRSASDVFGSPRRSGKVNTSKIEASAKTNPSEKEVVVRVRLPEGTTTLQAWFQDKSGADQCGAFYAYVQRFEPAR